MDSLTAALLIVLVIVQFVTLIELMLHRRTVKQFVDRGYKDVEDD